MANPDHDPEAVTQEASRLLQEGNAARAEELVLRAVQDAEARFGRDSPTYAAAQNALGRVLLNVGQVDRAVEAFRAAVSVHQLPDE
jgi:Tfp pilus assembly protein PilF